MEHSFNTDMAEIYGIEEAILFKHIAFWVEKNRANKSAEHMHEGFYFTRCSIKAFGELFPYMSEKTIRRALKNLCEEGVLFSEHIENPYNRTDRSLSYSLTLLGYSYLGYGIEQLHLLIRENAFTQKGECLIRYKHKIKDMMDIYSLMQMANDKKFRFRAQAQEILAFIEN